MSNPSALADSANQSRKRRHIAISNKVVSNQQQAQQRIKDLTNNFAKKRAEAFAQRVSNVNLYSGGRHMRKTHRRKSYRRKSYRRKSQ
jgi:hypothetical protein